MLAENGTLTAPLAVPHGIALDAAAFAAANWAFKNNIETGIGTATLPTVPWRFIPLRSDNVSIGILGALPRTMPPEPLAQTLAALANQAAMALERVRLTVAAAQTEAREGSQKLRTALLSSLSHDLRTPLTAIRGASETLSSTGDALDSATRADLLDSITQNTERMAKFLSNITEMARVETGEINARKERLLLSDVFEGAIARVSGAIYTGVNIADNATHVIADSALLEQIIVNCLDNAVKYAPPDSRIAISTQRQSDKITIAIADEGVGIPAADLPHVFDSFFRATRGDRIAPGTGLGLAIAKAFTEAMGGRISARSPRLDLPADGLPGTIITIELPAG
ncbi:MAG: hypothetical protein B7Y73_09565 [Acidocella sp. 35-58-6]|nr:MAG: hypothetical protein B7Y73_09565 [Acidocella sp. 35-58-6]